MWIESLGCCYFQIYISSTLPTKQSFMHQSSLLEATTPPWFLAGPPVGLHPHWPSASCNRISSWRPKTTLTLPTKTGQSPSTPRLFCLVAPATARTWCARHRCYTEISPQLQYWSLQTWTKCKKLKPKMDVSRMSHKMSNKNANS